jgi:hypothetical protein
MANQAMFEGLVYDEFGRPVTTGWVGSDACYVVDDDGFLRHIDAELVDRQVLQFFKEQVLSQKDLAIRAMLQLMGKDDIFTKTALEYQLEHMDEQLDQPMPPQARELLRSLGFRIIIDVQGNLLEVQSPDASALGDLPGFDGLGDFE